MREKESKLKVNDRFTSAKIAEDFLFGKRQPATEDQIANMSRLWIKFYTNILYPQQQAEEKLHPEKCTMFGCYHPWDPRCKTLFQEMWQWEDYVLQNYHEGVQVGGLDSDIG